MVFIDLEEYYYKASRDVLRRGLKKIGVPMRYEKII